MSNRGAVGLMQVMRFHAGVFDCDSDDLLQVEANICHGARVFASYLKRTRDVRSALLRYNGCVKTRATPSCRRYPGRFFIRPTRSGTSYCSICRGKNSAALGPRHRRSEIKRCEIENGPVGPFFLSACLGRIVRRGRSGPAFRPGFLIGSYSRGPDESRPAETDPI